MSRRALLVVPLCLAAVAGCSSGPSAAAKAKEAAGQAKAACEVFTGLSGPTDSSQAAQIDYAKRAYVGFLRSAELARRAVANDSQWSKLQTAAEQEAAAFEVIVEAADPKSSAAVDATDLRDAVHQSTTARVVFIAQCEKADPGFLNQSSPSATPSAPSS